MITRPPCSPSIFIDSSRVADALGGHSTLYLLIAVLCLLVALKFMKRVLAPVGAVVQAIAAMAAVALAVGAALILLVAAVVSGR